MSLEKILMPPQPPNPSKNRWKYLIAAALIVAIFHNFFGAVSYNIFVLLDNAFRSSGANSPLFIWSCTGVLFGSLIGSIVAGIKFRLGLNIKLLAGLPLALVLILCFAAAGPLGQISPRIAEPSANTGDEPLLDSSTIITDTTAILPISSLPTIAKQAADADHQITKEVPKPSCEEQSTSVSLTVRTDSVRLFFRVSQVKGGQWSEWDSIFIPRPGQYLLSGSSGKVTANSIQYYYEAKQEATRSESDPFSKSLCNGPLIINTF